jgi:type III secretion protein T
MSVEGVVVVAARMTPLALVAPWAAGLGGLGIVARLLVALGLSLLASALAPVASAPTLPLVASELLIGGVLGLLTAIPFRAAQAAGALVDVARGGGRTRGPLADALLLLALALFSALDGPRLVVAAALESYVALPPGALVAAPAFAAVAAAGARIIALAATLAAPILAALVLAELVGALAVRVASGRTPERGPASDVARQVVAVGALAAAAIALARGIAGGDAGLRGLPSLVGDVVRLLGGGAP